MSKQRWDVIHVVEKQDKRGGEPKRYWTKVGAAFERDNGNIAVTLQYVPLPTQYNGEPEIKFTLSLPRERDDQRGRRDEPAQQQGDAGDDDIPF